jgi:hypothetical protein
MNPRVRNMVEYIEIMKWNIKFKKLQFVGSYRTFITNVTPFS